MNISFLIFSATFLHSSICIFQRIDSNLCLSFQVSRSDLIYFAGVLNHKISFTEKIYLWYLFLIFCFTEKIFVVVFVFVFVETIFVVFIFSCPEQLNRWPCPLVRWLVPLTPLTIRAFTTLQTEWTWRLVSFETFDQSDEETWPDQKRSTYLPTYLPTSLPNERKKVL